MSNPADHAQAVLRFWFDEVGKEGWYAKDEALDREIVRRFGDIREQVVAAEAAGWRDSMETMMAAIILLDQFSRNMFRGSAKAFEADPLALELAMEALAKGWSHSAPVPWRQFLLMPLMHNEELVVQERSVEEFRQLGNPINIEFALKHRDQIARFGRFPGRNKALGRVSTADERALIDRGETF